MHEYSAQIIAVIDADTFKLDVDLGFRLHARHTFRLARCNAPELLSLEGMQARMFVVALLEKATAIKIHSSRSEKYGRWLCELFFQQTEQPGKWLNLNSLLLEQGYARPFKH